MDTEKLKQSVLMDLRSVILSCKGGVPLNRLQNDYKFLTGTTIPFANLGYNSMETFLQSIPQVIKLKKTSDGQTFVEAVADSSTVHLQNLISKQKNTKTPKCSVKRYGKKPAPKQKSSLCPNCASSRNAFTNSTGATSSASSSWSLASEVSNEKDKKEIESLKAQLAEQKDMNIKLKSRVNQLLSASEPHLEYIDEQIIIQRMKYQIGLLQKRILLRHAASPQALQVNRNINDIVEKIENLDVIVEKLSSKVSKEVNSSDVPDRNSQVPKFDPVPDRNSQQVPMFDPYKMYQQQCKETEELKKQVEVQNFQIQNIEKKMQSQHQKLQNQIKNDSPSIPSKVKLKSELAEDLKMELQEHSLQIENVEKNLTTEFLQLKKRVEEEYFVYLVRESEKLKEFEKQLKAQKSHSHSIESRMQSQLQKLQNKVDAINIQNLADKMVEQLVSRNLINIPQVLSTSNDDERYVPPHRRTQQSNEQMSCSSTNSSRTGTPKSGKKKKKAKTEPENSGSITSVMRNQ